jgi:hypothetical protein
MGWNHDFWGTREFFSACFRDRETPKELIEQHFRARKLMWERIL